MELPSHWRRRELSFCDFTPELALIRSNSLKIHMECFPFSSCCLEHFIQISFLDIEFSHHISLLYWATSVLSVRFYCWPSRRLTCLSCSSCRYVSCLGRELVNKERADPRDTEDMFYYAKYFIFQTYCGNCRAMYLVTNFSKHSFAFSELKWGISMLQ